MIRIEHLQVWGFEHALRGMRNPLNSWEKGDTVFIPQIYTEGDDYELAKICAGTAPIIKKNDMALCRALAKSGASHRKFMRQIFVSMDVTAPILWWKEMDQYKIGTGCTDFETDSCSTMHKIMAKPFEVDDFTHENMSISSLAMLEIIIDLLNSYRSSYYDENVPDKKMYWRQIIDLLPESYNQKRTVTMNYEVAANIYHDRRNHKLTEWHQFCKKILYLPYFADFMNIEEDSDGGDA